MVRNGARSEQIGNVGRTQNNHIFHYSIIIVSDKSLIFQIYGQHFLYGYFELFLSKISIFTRNIFLFSVPNV